MPTSTTVTLIDQAVISVAGTALTTTVMNDLAYLTVDLTADQPSMFELTLFDDELTHLNGTTFDIGKEVLVKFQRRDTNALTEVFKGEIVAFEPEYDDVHVTTRIIAFDKLHRLNRALKTRVFVDQTDSDIITAIAGENGLQTETITATTTVHKHVFQDNTSDLAFIQMLARRNGFELQCKLGKLSVKLPATSSTATLTYGTDLRYFRPRFSSAGQVTKVTVKGWDVAAKTPITATKTSSTSHPAMGLGQSGVALTNSKFGASEHVEFNSDIFDSTGAQKLAQARLDEINSKFVVAEGRVSGTVAIVPGALVTIANAGTKVNGTYAVTSARHIYSPENGYETEFTVEGSRPATVSSMIAPQTDPPRVWYGVVPAIVTNNAFDSNVGSAGKVKVKFPWLDDAKESYWARVASIGAGATRGIVSLPEVNDEVLVAFENGNFNKPYVLGGLWNGQDALPETHDTIVVNGAVVQRLWKTRTGHYLNFTEKSDLSTVELKEKGGTSLKLDGTNKVITLKDADGTFKITIDTQNKKITVTDGTRKVEISDSKILVDAASSDVEIKGSNIKLTATANVEIKGATVKLN